MTVKIWKGESYIDRSGRTVLILGINPHVKLNGSFNYVGCGVVDGALPFCANYAENGQCQGDNYQYDLLVNASKK